MIGAIVNSIPRDSVAKISIKINKRPFVSRALWISVNIGLKMKSANEVCHVTRKTRGPQVGFSNEELLKLSLTSVSCTIYRHFVVRLKRNKRVFWLSFLCNACSNRCTVVFDKESVSSNECGSLDIAFVCLARCEWHHQLLVHVYISTPTNIASHACRISMN